MHMYRSFNPKFKTGLKKISTEINTTQYGDDKNGSYRRRRDRENKSEYFIVFFTEFVQMGQCPTTEVAGL